MIADRPYLIGLWLIILGIPCSRALVEIGATLIILSWVWRKAQAGEWGLRRSILLAPLAAFVAWAALSLTWTTQWPLTLRAVISQTIEYAAIYLAVSDGLRNRQQLRQAIWLWLIWSLLMVGDGVVQLIRGTELIRGYTPGLIAGGARMTAAMKYPNDFACYLSLSALLAAGVAVAERTECRVLAWRVAAAIALINVIGLILTFSRGAWLGFAVAGLVAMIFYRTRYVVPLIVAAGIVVALLPAPYWQRLLSITDFQPGTAAQERLLIWQSVLQMIREHPWVGFGLNTYNATFPAYKDPAIWGTPYAHNCFLQLTAELGLIGLGFFTWILCRVFRQGWRPAQRGGWERIVALSLIAGAAGYVVQSSVETNWYSLPLAAMWWLTVGMIDSLSGIAEDRQRFFTERIRRIVAIRTDRLGDLLMNLPALRALRQRFPQATLTVVAQPPMAELLRGQPGLDAVMPYVPTAGPWGWAAWQWGRQLRCGRFDAAVVLNPTREAHLATWLAGIPIRVGYARKWDVVLTDTWPDRKAQGTRHEVEYNLELVGLLGAMTADRLPRLVVADHDRQVVHQLLRDADLDLQRPLVALHPWTSDPAKEWPLTSMAELIERLSTEETLQLLLIGGPDEEERARNFLAGVRAPITSFVGRLSLRQTAALLAHCRLLVSNDSGPVHVAAAIGTPTVTVFTGRRIAATPTRWGPVGQGHVVLTNPHPELPVTVEEVFEAVQRQLAKVQARE